MDGGERRSLIRIAIAIKKDLHLISIVKKAPRKVITLYANCNSLRLSLPMISLEMPRLPVPHSRTRRSSVGLPLKDDFETTVYR